MIRYWLLIFATLIGSAHAQDTHEHDPKRCVSASHIAKSVVRISGYYVDEMQRVHWDLGSAFFVTEGTEIMTVGHMAESLLITKDAWQLIEIFQERSDGAYTFYVETRIKEVFTEGLPHSDGLVILELKRPYLGPIEVAWLRQTPPISGEYMIGVGYTNGTLRSAWGNFTPPTSGVSILRARDQRFAAFELVAEADRNAIRPGASGGPIVDCHGAVVGAIARVHRWPEPPPGAVLFFYREYGIPIYRGNANVWAVPIHPVADDLLKRGY